MAAVLAGCEHLDNDITVHGGGDEPFVYITPQEVADLLGRIDIGADQMGEVHDAVCASSENGYDEEYTLRNLFASPGAGVGDMDGKSGGKVYEKPLRDLLRQAVLDNYGTKDGPGTNPEMFLEALESSDMQLYWPYSENWDGESAPLIAAAPEDLSELVYGYTPEGEKVAVDEQIAQERPVWVVNRNNDAGYTSLEMLRRADPSWGEGSSDIIVRTAEQKPIRTLVLRSFKAYRNYDPWYAGGSEFFVKCGSVDEFYASTEAELALYSPSITDFMIVVKRSQIGEELPFNAILVSDWTENLASCAFLVSEDDGGTITKWDCTAKVLYSSKSYGFEMSIPVKSKDDIVWRGQLTARYVEKYSGTPARFGDVDLVLELI